MSGKEKRIESPLGRQEADCSYLIEVAVELRLLLQCIYDNLSLILAAGCQIKVDCLIEVQLYFDFIYTVNTGV